MWFKNGLKAQKPLEAAWPEGQKLIEAARPERARGVHPGHEGSKSLRVIIIFKTQKNPVIFGQGHFRSLRISVLKYPTIAPQYPSVL